MPVSRRALWLALAALVLLAIMERWLVPGWLGSRGPVGPARWIGAPEPATVDAEQGAGERIGFFAVRDFEVEGEFESALLKVSGDEEFWVNLNGAVVAAGHRRFEPRLVVCEVGRYLRPGPNRLSVELRSARPSGGLLLSLEINGQTLRRVVTDKTWSIVRRHQPELSVPGAELVGPVPARVWGAPPTGRWGWPKEEGRQPALAELLVPGGAVPAVRARVGDPAGTWFRLPARPEQAAPLGHWVTFDFGAVQTGLLNITFGDPAPVKGLVFVGRTPPDPRAEHPDAVLLKVEGLNAWTRVVPRRFRYVTVIALKKVVGGRVYRVAPHRSRRLLRELPPQTGAFGLELPLRTPVEDEIWRDFERLARHGRPQGAEGPGGL